ncbi:MAG TPA: ABC transporter permease, partial [Symbiobacteriaceae bacterium]|nr:ABC transporter permease [Symbiobacteriaceae bacterium]
MLKLFRYLKPYWLPVVVILGLIYLQASAELYLPTLMADIVDKGIFKKDTDYIWAVGREMLLVASGGMALAIVSMYLSGRVASAFGRDLRSKVFSRVTSFSLHEFDQIGTATLITRTTNDITQVQQVMVMILRIMVFAPMMSIGGIVHAVQKDATLSWLIVVVIPVLLGVIGLLAAKGVPLFTVMQKKVDRLNLVVREGLTGIRVIRAFNRLEHESKRFQEANEDLTATAVKVNIIMATMMPAMMIIMNFTTIAIIWFGGIRIDNGEMQVGDL